jgi:phosphonate transport system ATP-binding protein
MDVRLDAVSLRYPSGHRALDSVSFSIPSGQFCAVLGRSGSGKSSLLRTVNGLVVPTAGVVAVGGVTATGSGLARLRPRIAMVHQDFALVGRATVAHNIVSGAAAEIPLWRALFGIASLQHRERACAVAQAVGLDPEMMIRRVDRLSGGQQQRVGIARAIMLDPSVILVDEPLSSLDPRTAREMLALLKSHAHSTGATVICSLHQPDLARQFADRIVGLDAGRVVSDCAADCFSVDDAAALYRDDLPRVLAVA